MTLAWNGGRILDADTAYECMVWMRDRAVPLLKEARDQCVGARREYYEMLKNCERYQRIDMYVFVAREEKSPFPVLRVTPAHTTNGCREIAFLRQ